MVKLFACDEAIKACDDCLQIMGGTGYTCDEVVEQYYRDARLMAIGGGTRKLCNTSSPEMLILEPVIESF